MDPCYFWLSQVEMKMIMKLDNSVLKQQFERKLRELEDEKLSLQVIYPIHYEVSYLII